MPTDEARSAQARGVQGRSGAVAVSAAPSRVSSAADQCSTDQEEWLPRGHRSKKDFSRRSENQGLTRVVRHREWCPDAATNSLCVNCVRVSGWVNISENMRSVLAGCCRVTLAQL